MNIVERLYKKFKKMLTKGAAKKKNKAKSNESNWNSFSKDNADISRNFITFFSPCYGQFKNRLQQLLRTKIEI